jgi:hypothetical protein
MYLIRLCILFKILDKISNQYQVFLSQLANQSEPATFEEAKINPIWCKAMEEEFQALEKK